MRPSGLMRTWLKLSPEAGEGLAHARFGKEQGQRLASFRERERSSRFLTWW